MDITDMAQRIRAGERRALARAITLVESGRDDHRAQATELLAAAWAENDSAAHRPVWYTGCR